MCYNMHFGNLFCGYYHWIMCYQLPFRVLSINSDKELREELYSWVFFGFDNWKLYYHMFWRGFFGNLQEDMHSAILR